MCKVILNHLKDKELVCPICQSTENFRNDGVVSLMDKHGEADKVEKIRCSCEWIMLLDPVGLIITEDVWDASHNGDTVISKF